MSRPPIWASEAYYQRRGADLEWTHLRRQGVGPREPEPLAPEVERRGALEAWATGGQQAESPESALLRHERADVVEQMIGWLERERSDRYRVVLEGRFWRDETYDEVGVGLGLTRERIRQIEATAIRMLRDRDDISELRESARQLACLPRDGAEWRQPSLPRPHYRVAHPGPRPQRPWRNRLPDWRQARADARRRHAPAVRAALDEIAELLG